MYDELKAWLEAQPRGRIIGVRNDPNRCVLSDFLSEIAGHRVTVRQNHTMPGRLRLPRWACQVYTYLDTSCRRQTGPYTVGTVLDALDRFNTKSIMSGNTL